MKIITQAGERFDLENAEIKISGSSKRIIIVLPDGHEATLGKYKDIGRRIEVFSEIYATFSNGQEVYKMPLK